VKQKIVVAYQWFWELSLYKKLGIFIVVAVLFWLGETKVLNTKAATPTYQTAVVERGTLISNISASGSVSSANSASITTSVTGVVTAVYVQNGDSVIQGQKIADLTPDQDSQQKQAAAYASLLSAQNSLNSAKAKMNSLQSTLFKANQSFMTDKGANNPSDANKQDPKYIEENAEWLQAESDYNNQAGVIAQAEAAYTSASLSYQQISSSIYAPAAGTVTNLTLSVGTPLTSNSSTSNSTPTTSSNASSSQSIGTITIEGGKLQAKVNLSEIDVTKAEVGQNATMTLDAFADKTFTGKLTAIDTSGSVSSGVTTYPTTITFDSNESKIYPNMAVTAKIITEIKDNVLLVPTSAIQTTNGTSTMRILKNGQITSFTVETGSSSDTQTEIVSGISEGDTVVTGSTSTATTGSPSTTSPFGGNGIGGLRTGGGGFGGGTGGNRTIIRGN
jgi:macrolide-specific efflux system membrane fusion protein